MSYSLWNVRGATATCQLTQYYRCTHVHKVEVDLYNSDRLGNNHMYECNEPSKRFYPFSAVIAGNCRCGNCFVLSIRRPSSKVERQLLTNKTENCTVA